MNYLVKNVSKNIKNNRVAVQVPGSKSITVRAMLMAALAKGKSTLYNAQLSDDCATFLNCLKKLGILCEVEGNTVKIDGCGGKLPVKSARLNVQSSGTAARFLTALLAFSDGEFHIDSSEQMKKRPMHGLIDSLSAAGATIISDNGAFPLTICGASDPATEITVDITKSSQFLSALLISGVCAKCGIKLNTVGQHGLDYVNMTLNMMWSFGVTVDEEGGAYKVFGEYSAKRYDIEPDISSACYFYAANKILGTDISVNGILPHSMQGDIKFINALKSFNGGRIDMSAFSDQALTLAAIAPYLDRPTTICGITHVREQECDRIKAIIHNLTAMGVQCDEHADGVTVYPSEPMPAKIKTFGDHRVAMAFSLTGLRADGIEIENAEVCSKTFKNYFEVLDKLCNDLTN